MSAIPHAIEAHQGHHLPIVKAYADKIGLVEVMKQLVVTEMDIDAGTIVLGLILDTLSGRTLLSRLQDFFAQHDTELLFGKAIPAEAFNDDTVGRVLDRRYDTGTSKLVTACAVRADQVLRFDTHYVHFETTSVSVYGDYPPPETSEDQAVPLTITSGDSKDKRPDLKQFGLSTLWVDRAVPLWGQPEDGNVSDKTGHTTILSEIARLLAHYGVKPGAYIYVADAALVTEDNLTALGDTLFISRLPATYHACERVIAEAIALDRWDEVGVLAHTTPTKHRPVASYNVAEGEVTRSGQPYRAVSVQSSTQDTRRLKRLERDVQASSTILQETVRAAPPHDYCCRAEAEPAAAQLRATQSPYHHIEVAVEERPKYGKGRPSLHQPRPVKEMRYGLNAVRREHDARLARKRAAADCVVLLTHVPAEGALAHRAEERLTAYKDQHGIEQNYSFLKDPLIVNSLFLKKRERIEALGLVLLLALLLWRLLERQMRDHGETTGTPFTGWDKKVTEPPTAFMMTTKFTGVLVLKVGPQRQLARPLSTVQQQYLIALGVSATCFTLPTGS